MRWMSLIAILFPIFASAQVPEYRASVVINESLNGSFTLNISNMSTVPRAIDRVQLSLTGGAVFDTFGTLSSVSLNPNVGPNNDGQSASSVEIRFSNSILPGQSVSSTGGDMDGSQPTGMYVVVTFDDGRFVEASASVSGSTWTATIVETETPTPLGEVDLSWTPPTTNTDGSPLTDLAKYKVYYGTMAGSYAFSRVIDDPGATEYTVDMLPYGEFYFVVTAINSVERESDYSNVVAVTVGPDPEAPVLEYVDRVLRTVDTIAYSDQKQKNVKAMRPIADVDLDVECIASEGIMVNGEVYYAVPVDMVTFIGSARSEIVYGRCE